MPFTYILVNKNGEKRSIISKEEFLRRRRVAWKKVFDNDRLELEMKNQIKYIEVRENDKEVIPYIISDEES